MDPPVLQRHQESCFEIYGDAVEIMMYKEFKNKAVTQLTKVQVNASLKVKYFTELSKVAVARLKPGSGSIGIVGLLMYLQRAKRVLVITSDIKRANALKKSLALPLNEDTFFERANVFLESWSEDDKNKFLPTGKIDLLLGPIKKFCEDILFVYGSAALDKTAHDWLIRKVSPGFKYANLVIVDNANSYEKEWWDLIMNEYARVKPEGRLIFISKSEKYSTKDGVATRYYDPGVEAFNAEDPDNSKLHCE